MRRADNLEYAEYLEIREPHPPGTLRACSDLYKDCSPFHLILLNARMFIEPS